MLIGPVLYNDGKSGQVTMMEGNGKHIVSSCGEEFDGSHLRLKTSRWEFGLSPFAIVSTHQGPPLASVLKLYSAIRDCSEEDKGRYL